MALSIFTDKTHTPQDADLEKILSQTYLIWISIKKFVLAKSGSITEQWNNSGTSSGWGFRLRDKKRAIVYMIPCEGYFKIGLVFGEKATQEALNSDISEEIKTIIKTAKVYAEGRGFRIDIKDTGLLEDIKKLIEIKMK